MSRLSVHQRAVVLHRSPASLLIWLLPPAALALVCIFAALQVSVWVCLCGLAGACCWTLLLIGRFRAESITLYQDCLIYRHGLLRATQTIVMRYGTVIDIQQGRIEMLLDIGDVLIVNGTTRIKLRNIAQVDRLQTWCSA